MQNKTDVVGISLPEKIKVFASGNRRLLSLGAAAAAGYVMANCFLFGGISPFGVAFVAALGGSWAMCGAAGALLGYLFSANMFANIKYMVALSLVVCAKWIFGGRAGKKWEVMAPVGTCFLCLGICSAATLFFQTPTLYDVISAVSELFLGCGASYFFARALAVIPEGLQSAGRTDLSCAAIALCVVLMGFTSIRIANLSAGRVLGVLLILLCACYGREAGGAISGITAGAAIGLAGGDPGYIIGAYGFGGLAAGIFGRAGRVATAAAFIVVNTVSALLSMEYDAVNLAIYEVFAASVLFIAIPGGWASRFRIRGFGVNNQADSFSAEVLRERLDDLSGALKEIGQTTHAVNVRLDKMEDSGAGGICDRVAERVCAECQMKTSCWQLRHSVTMNALNDGVTVLRKNGFISAEQMPQHFLQGCCKPDELVAELSAQFSSLLSRERAQRKVSKVRAVLTDQFEGIAMMLDELSAELDSSRPLDEGKTQRVRDYFIHRNIPFHRLTCSEDADQRIVVELVMPNYQAARVAGTRAALDLCAILEADFDLPEVTCREKFTTFTFCEKAAYTVELGAYQLASGTNRLCGDAYDFIRNKGGCAHFVLSDGMGIGGGAAVDSSMACGLLVKLMSVGVGYESALKMVNSALLVKSGEESLATIDVCALDLFTGKARFYKAGAAPTFIVKGGKAGYVESASLPAGILQGVSFEKSSVTLHDGDIIVMVSDGVTATGADWIKSELGGVGGTDMQRLCEKIALTAKMRRVDGHDDDITVLAAALHKVS